MKHGEGVATVTSVSHPCRSVAALALKVDNPTCAEAVFTDIAPAAGPTSQTARSSTESNHPCRNRRSTKIQREYDRVHHLQEDH